MSPADSVTVHELAAKVDGLREDVAAEAEKREQDQRDIRHAIRQVNTTLLGDGQRIVGLVPRVQALEAVVSELKRLIRYVGVAIVGLFLNFAWEIAKAYLEARGGAP